MVVALDVSPLDLVTKVRFHPVPLVVIAALAVGYGLGVRRLARQGQPWPKPRSYAFVTAEVLLAVATLSGLDAYDRTSFSVAAVQQIGILMLAPVALCLSAPLTLLIESGPSGLGSRLRTWVEGAPGRVLYNPALTWAVFGAGVFTLYLSHEYAWALSHVGGVLLVDLELLVIGCLYFVPVLGADPKPRDLGIGWRSFYVLLGFLYYSVLGLAMESQRTRIAPNISVSDLHTGAGVFWTTGTLLTIAVTIGMVVFWLGDDEGRARQDDTTNAEEDARQLALWRTQRRAVALADVRASESVAVNSRVAAEPEGTLVRSGPEAAPSAPHAESQQPFDSPPRPPPGN